MKSSKKFAIIIFFVVFNIVLSYMIIDSNVLIKDSPFSSLFSDNNRGNYQKYVYDNNNNIIETNQLSENDILKIVDSFTEKNIGIPSNDVDIDMYSKFDSSLNSKYNCVYNSKTESVIYGNNIYDAVANASTTKIMTCIIALEYGNPDDEVMVSAYAASMPKVKLNMTKSDKYKLNDLLYSLMLESHNDTAVAIAEHIAGSVEGFAILMNNKAKEIGCVNTNFVTPNGLDDELHHSCAYDLCLIASYALNNEEFVKIINTPNKTISTIDGKRTFYLTNHDSFLNMYKGAIGVKTGFTSKAGYCFVGGIKHNDIIYTSAVLACGWPPNKSLKWKDTKELFDYAVENEEIYELMSLDTIYSRIEEILLNNTKIYNEINLDMKKATDCLEYSFVVPKTDYTVIDKNSINIIYFIMNEINICDLSSPIGYLLLSDDNDKYVALFAINAKRKIKTSTKYDYFKEILRIYF